MKLIAAESSSAKILIILFILINMVLWLPAIFIPFWGDDYYFLMQAREARLSNTSWLTPFISESSTGFWRPLSMDVPWRFIEGYLDGHPIKAHCFSFVIWFISITCTYLLTFNISKALKWDKPEIISMVAACLYSFSAVHFLVLHWVSAINSSFLVIFISLSLSLWVAICYSSKNRLSLYALFLAFQMFALFSKESAVLLPALMLSLSLFIQKKLKVADTVILIVCVAICVVWLYFFQQFTHNRNSSYEIVFGTNIIHNTIALFAWALNIPRESIRMLFNGQTLSAINWLVPILILMAAFIFFVINGAKKYSSKYQLIAIIGFVIFAYVPYFLLSHQSYEYYAAVAIILPTIFASKCLLRANRFYVGLLLFAAASFISIQGSRILDYPSLIGRAYWAEAQLDRLKNIELNDRTKFCTNNHHRFYAIGIKGLSWRLGIPETKILFSNICNNPSEIRL